MKIWEKEGRMDIRGKMPSKIKKKRKDKQNKQEERKNPKWGSLRSLDNQKKNTFLWKIYKTKQKRFTS